MDSSFNVREKETNSFTTTIRDENGVVIPAANMTSITLTLWDRDTEAIINSRNAQNVLNANGGTYHATSGLFTWLMTPADNQILNNLLSVELHVALFEWTYVAGARRGQHEALFVVVNSRKVT